MSKWVTKSAFTIGFLALLLAVPALGATVNKSIKIAAGSESDGASSVNGSISVGENAVVSGNVKTVNGTIRIDAGASVKKVSTVNGAVRLAGQVGSDSLSTVNGSIRVGAGGLVDGEVTAVNGRIILANGVQVSDNVSNVNGEIELTGAEVAGDLTTVNGDVSLEDGAWLKGDLVVKENSGWGWGKSKSRKPRLVIGPGSRVTGTIRLEREVDLFISETAKVGAVEGKMSMDDAVRFAGERP